MQAKFHAMLDDHAVFENVPSSILQPKSAWCVFFGGQSLCHGTASCLSVFCKPGEMVLVLAGHHGIGLGCLKSAAVVSRVSTTRVARSVSSLLPGSPSLSADGSADEPSRSKRYRPCMHFDVDLYETSTTGFTPDSELFTVLPADAARVTGEEVQPRNPSRVRSSTDVTYTIQGMTNTYPKATRRRRV